MLVTGKDKSASVDNRPESDSDDKISPWLAGGVLTVLVGIFIMGGLIAKRVYLDMPTPRTALERDLVVYKRQLKQNPNDAGIRVKLAQAYYRMDNTKAALSQLRVARKIDPGLWEVHFVQGLIALDKKQTGAAIKAFERAKRVDPRNELSYYHLGVIYLEDDRYKLSVKNLEEAVKLDGGIADAQYSLGLAYEHLNNKDKALEHFEKALEYVPNFREAKIARRRVLN